MKRVALGLMFVLASLLVRVALIGSAEGMLCLCLLEHPAMD